MTDKYADRRQELFRASLKEANTSKFGYFGYTAPLAVGDDSLAPRRTIKTDFRRANALSNPSRSGMTNESFFSVATPLCVDDPYVDPGRRAKTKRKTLPEGTPAFRGSGSIPRSTNKLGYLYEPQGSTEKKRSESQPRNFLCNASAKGSAGSLGNSTLFGFGEERRSVPEHVPDDYNNEEKIMKEERLRSRAKMPEVPFKGGGTCKLGL